MDRVNCARCGMVISSDANAGQLQIPDAATRFYDDIGCLAADAHMLPEGSVQYVRLDSGDWARVADVSFARPAEARTPMDYAIVAFATEEEARAADRDRRPRNWNSVLEWMKAR